MRSQARTSFPRTNASEMELPVTVLDRIARQAPRAAHAKLVQFSPFHDGVLDARLQCLQVNLPPCPRRPRRENDKPEWDLYHEIVENVLQSLSLPHLRRIRTIRLIRHVSERCRQLDREIVPLNSGIHQFRGFFFAVEIYQSSCAANYFDICTVTKARQDRSDLILLLLTAAAWLFAFCLIVADTLVQKHAVGLSLVELCIILHLSVDCGLLMMCPSVGVLDCLALALSTYWGIQSGLGFMGLFQEPELYIFKNA